MAERFNKTPTTMQKYLMAREAEGFRRITVFVHDDDRDNLRRIAEAMLMSRGWSIRQ